MWKKNVPEFTPNFFRRSIILVGALLFYNSVFPHFSHISHFRSIINVSRAPFYNSGTTCTFSGNGRFFWKKTTPKSEKMGFLTMAMMCFLAKNGKKKWLGLYRMRMRMMMMMRGNECWGFSPHWIGVLWEYGTPTFHKKSDSHHPLSTDSHGFDVCPNVRQRSKTVGIPAEMFTPK